jgi:hypothetical protein
MTFVSSVDLHDALLVGGAQAWLDAGSSNAYIEVYASTQPSPGDPVGDAPLVIMVLAKPSTILLAHRLVFIQSDLGGDLINTQGNMTWGRLYNGAGVWAGDGTASDDAGSGDFKVTGTTGTLLYAGARAILGLTTFG